MFQSAASTLNTIAKLSSFETVSRPSIGSVSAKLPLGRFHIHSKESSIHLPIIEDIFLLCLLFFS